MKKIRYNEYRDPLFIQNKRMKEIDDIMTPLELELDKLRSIYSYYNKPEILDKVRELRKKLGILDKEYYDISQVVNKEWHNQKPIWKKLPQN